MTSPPGIARLLETFLVVKKLESACAFYHDVLGLEFYSEPNERGCVFRLPGDQILGLVSESEAEVANKLPGGTIPPVVAESGPRQRSGAHLALAVSGADMEKWNRHLNAHGVDVLRVVEWERGGRSMYVRDPDGHLLELATPGVWDFY